MRRMALAREIAPAYLRNPHVAAVLVAGSVGRGIADERSDLELDVFWSVPPSEDERRVPIDACGGVVRAFHLFEDDEWAETFEVAGVKVDTSMFLTATVDRYLAEVVEQASTDPGRHVLIAAVQDGVPLHGHELVAHWRTRAASYPDRLAFAMVAHHLARLSRWPYAQMLAVRDDAVMLHSVLGEAARTVLGLVLALNRRYLPHPGFKWLNHIVAGMALVPPDLAGRLRAALRAEPRAAVDGMRELLVEALTLLDAYLPGAGTGPGWELVRRANGR